MTVIQWQDNKLVLLASSYVGAEPISSIERYNKNEHKKISIPCPQIVKHYNTYMGGVDLCDMLIALYKTKYKCKKWYFPIFIQIIDICVNNTWILFRVRWGNSGTTKSRGKTGTDLQVILNMCHFRKCTLFLLVQLSRISFLLQVLFENTILYKKNIFFQKLYIFACKHFLIWTENVVNKKKTYTKSD